MAVRSRTSTFPVLELGAGAAVRGTRRAAAAVVLCLVAVVLPGCADRSSTLALPEPPTIGVQIVHGEQERAVRTFAGASVGAVLAAADVEPAEGQVRSVVEGEALGPNGHAARIEVDGDPATIEDRAADAATITVVDGDDTTERTETSTRPLAAGGLPDVLQHVHASGRPGTEEVVAGERSGEVVSTRTIEPPVPAHRATGKVLALTFDDGPDPTWTPQVLDILAAEGVTATFCMVGRSVDAHPELVERIAAEGHQLCNHTVNHVVDLGAQPASTIDAEIAGASDRIAAAAGKPPAFYRPPGGTMADSVTQAAAALDERLLYWSVDPRDWKRPPADELLVTVVSQFEPGAIIVLHDGGGDRRSTVEALPGIIEYARALGYTFTPPVSGRPQVG